jgi:hypothetical protein
MDFGRYIEKLEKDFKYKKNFKISLRNQFLSYITPTNKLITG